MLSIGKFVQALRTLDYIGYTETPYALYRSGRNPESSLQKVKLRFVTKMSAFKKKSKMPWYNDDEYFFLPVHMSPLLEHLNKRLELQIILLLKLVLAKINTVFTNYIQE